MKFPSTDHRFGLSGNAQLPSGAETHHKIVGKADDNHVAFCHFLAPDISP
jgi:hypothetical protein